MYLKCSPFKPSSAVLFCLLLMLNINAEAQDLKAEKINSVPQVYADPAGLKAGDKFPDITFKDTDGKDVKIDQFEGKYIYIDVWASWCYPCRKEYPKLTGLKTRMKDKSISFIGISCDTREDRWKGAMRDNKINGIQWLLKNREFMRVFKVGTVPRYILLNRNGEILTLNMERPSSPQIDSLIKSLPQI